MAVENLTPTKDAGVFYVEHPTRKHGVRRDRKIILRYTIKGKTRKEVYGWESQGFSCKAAALKIEEFRQNAKDGGGSVSLADEREAERQAIAERQAKEAEEQQRAQRENLTLDAYFRGPYLDAARLNKKQKTVGSEVALYEKWVAPSMGHLRFWEIRPIHFQGLKKKVLTGDHVAKSDGGGATFVPRSPRTLHYCVSLVIQAWNMAFDNGLVDVQPPRRKTLNLPMIDNEKTKAFTPGQANEYFTEMKVRSPQWHDISAISLYAGLRASEIFRLEVKDFDEDRGMIFLKTPKKQRSQTLVLNGTAKGLLSRLKAEHTTGSGLFFTNSKGQPIKEVSDTVQRVIDGLGFNRGVEDRRDKLTFHSWRHTFATWLRDMGDADLFTINNLLRHSNLKMTMKYVHPNKEKMRAAAQTLDTALGGIQGVDEVGVVSLGKNFE